MFSFEILQVPDSTWPEAWKDWRLKECSIWSKEIFVTSYILSASLPLESRRFCCFLVFFVFFFCCFFQKLIWGEHLSTHHALWFPEQYVDSGPLFSSASRQTEHSSGQVLTGNWVLHAFFRLYFESFLIPWKLSSNTSAVVLVPCPE